MFARRVSVSGAVSSLARNFSKQSEIAKKCKEYTMFSWSAQKTVDPIVMARAEGVYFWDETGKRYLDLNSQLMCSNIGHQHPRVLAALKEQVDELCFAGPAYATRVRAEFGPLLAKHTPGSLNKFFFTLGGAEANENAIKFARFHTGRNKIISRYKSYHGATHGAIMLTGDYRRWPNEVAPMGGVVRAYDPYKYRSLLYRPGMTDEEFSILMLKQLEEQILYENPNNIAAMIVETVTGTNGIIPPPQGYLQGLRKLLTKYGILMICDEVMCGLGRTGEWFACDHWSVVPDILTMAKGVTSAYMPLGVVAISPEIAATFEEKVFSGGLTYQGHPMCLAAGCATLKVLEEENIVQKAKETGIYMASLLQSMKDKHISVGDVRSIGLFGALELVKNRYTKEPFVPAVHPAIGKMQTFMKERGVVTFINGNILHTNPPLIITKEELDEAFKVIDEALNIADSATVA